MSFGKVTSFRSLAAVAPMIKSGIEEWKREWDDYQLIKRQPRGLYQKRKR